jgi:SAM-dependent methyltransferase
MTAPTLYRSKYRQVASCLADGSRSVLDVGCRDGTLKKHLPASVSYTGVDLAPGPMVSQVCNLEKGLPFEDCAFDTVVALDVLEHTDDIWFAFDELARVARLQVLAVLPNSYHWKNRIRFLRGREPDKYVLPGEPIVDRHRWHCSYTTSHDFIFHRAARLGLSVTEFVMVDERPNAAREALSRVFSVNLMCVAAFFDLRRGAQAA